MEILHAIWLWIIIGRCPSFCPCWRRRPDLAHLLRLRDGPPSRPEPYPSAPGKQWHADLERAHSGHPATPGSLSAGTLQQSTGTEMENTVASAPLADGSPVRLHVLYRVRSSLCQHLDGDNLLHCWAGAGSGEHLVTSRAPDGDDLPGDPTLAVAAGSTDPGFDRELLFDECLGG